VGFLLDELNSKEAIGTRLTQKADVDINQSKEEVSRDKNQRNQGES
jgi:hypothetical protein